MANVNLLELIDINELGYPLSSTSTTSPDLFTYNPFPYLPPELIVTVLSHTPADSIPQLYRTNHFFQLHIQIYQRQLLKIRISRYPPEILSAYTSIHSIDLPSLHSSPNVWSILSKFEEKANTCLSFQHHFLPRSLPPPTLTRYYIAFLRQWESRQNMFFPKEQWQEALLDRFHIYEDCTRSEICDLVHLQMFYRNLLGRLPWSEVLTNDTMLDPRIQWAAKSDLYRHIIDQLIGCGPVVILHLLSSPHETLIPFLRECVAMFESADERQVRFCCFDDVMAKLLTRFDGGEVATRWQEEESYFDICASTAYFSEGNVRTRPFRHRFL